MSDCNKCQKAAHVLDDTEDVAKILERMGIAASEYEAVCAVSGPSEGNYLRSLVNQISKNIE